MKESNIFYMKRSICWHYLMMMIFDDGITTICQLSLWSSSSLRATFCEHLPNIAAPHYSNSFGPTKILRWICVKLVSRFNLLNGCQLSTVAEHKTFIRLIYCFSKTHQFTKNTFVQFSKDSLCWYRLMRVFIWHCLLIYFPSK